MIKYFIQKLLWKFNYDLSRLNFNRVDIQEFYKLLSPIEIKNYKLKRFGNLDGDGGYILPNNFDQIDYLFSLGVGKEFSFEKNMKDLGINCFLADWSIDDIGFEKLGLDFKKKFIKAYNSEISSTFEMWKKSCLNSAKNGEYIIQIDIEGDEYQVLLSISDETFFKTKYLIIEYHFLTRIFDVKLGNLIMSALKRVSENFYPIHLNVNNTSSILKYKNFNIPHCLEVSYINKKYVKEYDFLKDSNSHLNRSNTRNSHKILKVPKQFFFN